MAASKSADNPLLLLSEALATIDAALASDLLDDVERVELTAKWMSTAAALVPIRARTPKGKRVKAIALQWAAGKLSPEPNLFVDLALSLARDLAAPLPREAAP